MIATKYNEKMSKEEFIDGLKSVFAMSNYYMTKYPFKTVGSSLAAEYYGEYYDANPDLCEKIESEI